MVREYLAGTWDDLSAEMTTSAKNTLALPPAEKTDVEYIRKTIADCRPAWWKTCKSGTKAKFRPVVWGHTLSATYDPTAKMNIQYRSLQRCALGHADLGREGDGFPRRG